MSIKKEDACAHSLKSQTTQRKITVEDELTVAVLHSVTLFHSTLCPG